MNHPARRARQTHSQWQAIITEFNQSHLPAQTFCTDHDLSYGTFAKWRRRFTNSKQQKTEPAKLIELIQPVSTDAKADQWQVALELGNNITLRLRIA